MHIIDGKHIAARLREELAERVRALPESARPGLAVVLVGDDPASQVYVRNKVRACAEVGINNIEHYLPETTTEDEVLSLIADLNGNPSVHGILVQQPLPKHMNAQRVNEAIAHRKDADGFHPVNVGKMMLGLPAPLPCTPAGIMYMLAHENIATKGKHAVVVGRSNIVGKPMAQLLLAADATVTICHRHTANLSEHLQQADIIVCAVGTPGLIRGSDVKAGAVVIDVGINRSTDGKLVGDVAFDEMQHAAAVTPVPGGVGPMTIALLLHNTVALAESAA